MTDFGDRYRAKLAASGVGRDDLSLQDAKTIEDGRAVRILATYSDQFGPPSRYDIQHWISRRMGDFASLVSARVETFAVYPERAFLTFVLETKQQRLPLSAAYQMVKASVDQYLDAESHVWSVVKTDGGTSFLVKNSEEPIEAMMAARKAALRAGSNNRKAVLLASIEELPVISGGYAAVGLDDLVDFYHGGMEHRGRVKSATATGVKIDVAGDVFTVDPQAIIHVVEKSAASEQEDANINRRYWSLVYPGNPKMVEVISPEATVPVPKDCRPLKVEPIQAVTGSAKVGAARPTRRVPPR